MTCGTDIQFNSKDARGGLDVAKLVKWFAATQVLRQAAHSAELTRPRRQHARALSPRARMVIPSATTIRAEPSCQASGAKPVGPSQWGQASGSQGEVLAHLRCRGNRDGWR
jgi:hypothetical protein